METTDPDEAAARFNALYRRWAGAIPPESLAPFLAWYRTLSAPDRQSFRRAVATLVLQQPPGRNVSSARRILRAFNAWFPPST